jgi:hypothetical protein
MPAMIRANEEHAMTRPRTDQAATMRQHSAEQHDRRSAGDDARQRLLAAIPVRERRLVLADVATAALGTVTGEAASK